jgi:hypothetical protein
MDIFTHPREVPSLSSQLFQTSNSTDPYTPYCIVRLNEAKSHLPYALYACSPFAFNSPKHVVIRFQDCSIEKHCILHIFPTPARFSFSPSPPSLLPPPVLEDHYPSLKQRDIINLYAPEHFLRDISISTGYYELRQGDSMY